MLRFIGRRLLVAIPTLFLVITLAFFMMRAAPGGPFDMDRRLPPEIERNVRARYGLDQPLPVQYLSYLGGIARGDLGPACAGLITGSLVVEQIFNLPGLGKFFVISALQRDYTVVMGMVIVYAGLILLLNLLADLLYAVLDPRVRLT